MPMHFDTVTPTMNTLVMSKTHAMLRLLNETADKCFEEEVVESLLAGGNHRQPD